MSGSNIVTLNRVATWLNSIGLVTKPGKRSDQSFMRGIWFDCGCIVYDPDEAHPGDLLHEAGHLAIVPARFRHFVKGEIEESLASHYDDYLKSTVDCEDATLQAIIQSGDAEAIAWSYAASLACCVDPWLCFVNGFDGEAESVFQAIKLGCHPGINGLRASGMLTSVRDFPHLVRWLQK